MNTTKELLCWKNCTKKIQKNFFIKGEILYDITFCSVLYGWHTKFSQFIEYQPSLSVVKGQNSEGSVTFALPLQFPFDVLSQACYKFCFDIVPNKAGVALLLAVLQIH